MIQEAYVSFETAKLLKEKGFDEPCHAYYEDNGYAFIEKAADWLRTHSEADYFELIPDANYCGAGNLNKKKMIEDFKKYVKGE